jgi:hypothetical protein
MPASQASLPAFMNHRDGSTRAISDYSPSRMMCAEIVREKLGIAEGPHLKFTSWTGLKREDHRSDTVPLASCPIALQVSCAEGALGDLGSFWQVTQDVQDLEGAELHRLAPLAEIESSSQENDLEV